MPQTRTQVCRGKAGGNGFSQSLPWPESEKSWAKGLRPLRGFCRPVDSSEAWTRIWSKLC